MARNTRRSRCSLASAPYTLRQPAYWPPASTKSSSWRGVAMVRRFANQVHKQVSRLMLTRYIEREPKWFQAVLDNPPLPLPPRAPPPRTDYDLPPSKQSAARSRPPKHGKPLNPKALPIAYLEDELRRQFFKDHPFEAYRSKSLLEDGEIEPEHPISGEKWTRLRQRGRNPSPEE